MKNLFLLLIFLSFISTGYCQTYDDFKKDFTRALSTNFSKASLDSMFDYYSDLFLIDPVRDLFNSKSNNDTKETKKLPLEDFTKETVYKDNIERLVNSDNILKREFGYMVICGTGDKTFESNLLDKLKTEKDFGNLLWAGFALMNMNTTHTTVLFDLFATDYEFFMDNPTYNLFINLNKDSLLQTAYSRIESIRPSAKTLAASILSETELNPRTEKVLKDAVINWDMPIKCAAINSIEDLRIGNLLKIMKPLMDSSQTWKCACQALASSPTKEDSEYIISLASKGPLSQKYLDCLSSSKNISVLKKWLELIVTDRLGQKYVFLPMDQSLLHSDILLPDVQQAIEKSTNPEVSKALAQLLKGRDDKKSKEILLKLLIHNDPYVRNQAAWALEGIKSTDAESLLPQLIRNDKDRVNGYTDLAITYRIDTLQSLYESFFKNSSNFHVRMDAMRYLSAFPKSSQISFFRNRLK